MTIGQPIRQFSPQSLAARRPNQPIEHVAFFAADGTPLIISAATQAADTGGTVKLTGYTAQTGGNITAADTLNQALAKIEVRLHAGSL